MASIAFTKRTIEALASPTKGRIYFQDEGSESLSICVTTAGAKTFYVVRFFQGEKVRIPLGKFPTMTVDEARRACRAIVTRLAGGIDVQAARRFARKEPTLAVLWESYLELHAKPQKKSWQDDKRLFGKYLSTLHSKRLSAISQAMVAKWHATVGRDHGPIQANRCKALLTTMFSKASTAVGFTGPNPCKGVASFPEHSRERFLMPNEVQPFFNALAQETPFWQAFFLLCLFTGTRKGNVASMRWDELDLTNNVWYIPSGKAKAGKPLAVVLCEPAMAILQTRFNERGDGPYVFKAPDGNGPLIGTNFTWQRIVANAGLADLHVHDLRRTQGSWQAAAGIPLNVIAKSLGHADLKSTQVYARLQLDPVRQAVSGASQALLTAGKATIGSTGMVLDVPSVPSTEEADSYDLA